MFRVADGEEVVDEIATYQQSRYLSAMESAWRLLAYPVHDHAPTVEQLRVHLGSEDQPLRFAAGDRLDEVVQRGVDTKLTSFFKLCAEDEFAATLLYHQVPRFFTWQQPTRSWRRRRRGAPHPEGDGEDLLTPPHPV
ncbi:hypothetical protein FJT64_025943 [Amphibalanus amphitrite]|uniref:Uncharacterized protein n=1 Tax=Amphibalanus amphitrite TaxID=1232801 RepID=A0A6A4WIJ4_AMPAM|nr:hypothetical protein FJT64_025943 [Amphibalanus amphitrite]